MNLYFYTRTVQATGQVDTIPFNGSHHASFADHQSVAPFRAGELMRAIIERWNAFRPDLYHYAISCCPLCGK